MTVVLNLCNGQNCIIEAGTELYQDLPVSHTLVKSASLHLIFTIFYFVKILFLNISVI